MAADFKSHILNRDEKGFAGIAFKRLLLGGISGGLAYTLFRLLLPDLAIPVGVVVALALVVLTSSRGGLPLWLRLWIGLRGSLVLAAVANPTGLSGEIAHLLNLPLEAATLDGGQVFAALTPVEVDLREWVTFAQPRELDSDDGLIFVASPLEEGWR